MALRTRINADGYHEFWSEREGRWMRSHRRAMEKMLGRPLGSNEHVHHINGDPSDNRYENLTALSPGVHHRIHHVDPDACFRCGRSGHWADECYASTDYRGRRIRD